MPPRDADRFSEAVVEPKIEIGRIEHWPLLIEVVRSREVAAEPLPVMLFMYQAGAADQNMIPALRRIASSGKLVGIAIPCITPIDPNRPNTIPEFAILMDWLEANGAEFDIAATRVGIWVHSPSGHVLHTLERGTRDLLSSSTIPFQSEGGGRPDGGMFEVEQFFNRQLRGEATLAGSRPGGRRGGGRQGETSGGGMPRM